MSESDSNAAPEKPKKTPEEIAAERNANLAKARAARKAKAEARKAEAAAKKDDASDTEVVDGQKLVRVDRSKANGNSKFKTLADVLEARPRPKSEQRTEEAAAAAAAAETFPSIEDIARRDAKRSSHSIDDPVPPAEWEPERRDRPSMEPVEPTRTKKAPRSLMDLMSLVPSWSAGQYYVQVDRKKPTSWGGNDIGGLQARITQYMDDRDFTHRYGGGKYELVLFGPPASGGEIDHSTGKRRYRALTDAVNYTIPQSHCPPQITVDEWDGEFEEDTDMRTYRESALGRGRPATNADARMFETQLQHEERAEERRRREWKERQEERVEAEREAKNRDISLFELMEERREREAARAREDAQEREQMQRQQYEREVRMLRDELKKNNERPSSAVEMGETFAKLMTAMKTEGTPKEDVARIEQAAAQDRERLTKQHQGEMERLQQSYDQRIRDITERSESRVKEAEERASARVREVEERSDRRVREVESQAQQRMEDVRGQSQRDLAQAQTNSDNRIGDLTRQHERDLSAKNDAFQMQLAAMKNTYDSRIALLETEVNRERAEKDRLRTELEQAKDLPTQVEKFKNTATLLGMSEGGEDGPKDWKGMLLQLGTQLPDMIRSAGDTVMQMRGGQGQQPMTPEQQQAYQQHMYEQMQAQAQHPQGAAGYAQQEAAGQSLAFGTEDGPGFEADEYDAPAPPKDQRTGPMPVTPGPHAPQAEPAAPAPEQQTAPPPPPPQGAPAPQQAAMVHQPEQQPNPAQPPAPQQQRAPAAVPVDDNTIMQYQPVFEQALAEGVEPDEFAADLIETVGPQMARSLWTSVKPDRVLQTLQRRGVQSALVRRAGQQWLRAVWTAVAKRLGIG